MPIIYNIELCNQSRKMCRLFHSGLVANCGVIHHFYEEKWHKGKQSWRNPIHFRVSFPSPKERWSFIRETGIWVERMRLASNPVIRSPQNSKPLCFNRADRMLLEKTKRRSYHLPRYSHHQIARNGYIRDFHPVHGKRIFEESSNPSFVEGVLAGDIESIL